MMRGLPATMALLASALAALLLPGLLAPFFPPWLRSLLAAYGLFLAPGLVVASVWRSEPFDRVEHGTIAALISLAAQSLVFLVIVSTGRGIDTFLPLFSVVCVLLAGLSLRDRPPTSVPRPSPRDSLRVFGRPTVTMLIVAFLLFDSAAAWHFTSTGSVDRWWYLAYIRHWLEAPAIGFGEPFFAGDFTHPRFGFNAWMLSMTAWSRIAAVDPVWLYHRACPVLLVPAAFAALYVLARRLFCDRRSVHLAVLAGGLLWAGGTLFPVATRMPEDKIMALLVPAPLTMAFVLYWIERPSPRSLALLATALFLQACVHPLIYALVLLVSVPYAALSAMLRVCRPATAAVALGLLLLGAAYPALSGMRAASSMVERGASFEHADNPVVRIHRSRARTQHLDGDDGYVVHTRLLARPLLILALASVFLVFRRRQKERLFLLPATFLPLAIAFVPPLPALAGEVLLPWMVYRVLWIIPWALLLGVGLDEAMQVWRRRPWLPLAVVIIAVAPWPIRAWRQRSTPQRQALAPPHDESFRRLLQSIASLPATTVLAAPSEISERIPALTGRHVLALSDRGTWVFAGSNRHSRDRLRARAALMAGLPQAPSSAPAATHLLTVPAASASRLCKHIVFREDGFLLCSLGAVRRSDNATNAIEDWQASSSISTSSLERALRPTPRAGDRALRLVANCTPEPDRWQSPLRWPRTGPWSSTVAQARCTLELVRSGKRLAFRPRALELSPLLGVAGEELLIVGQGSYGNGVRWRFVRRIACRDGQRISLPLNGEPIDRLRLEITPTFLPFLKFRELRLLLAETTGQTLP